MKPPQTVAEANRDLTQAGEIDRLRAEVERLLAILENVVSALEVCDPAFWPLREKCREAIKEKP